MHVEHNRRCLLLHSLPQFSDAQLAALLQHYGSVDALWQSDPRSWPDLAIADRTATAFRYARDHNCHRQVSRHEGGCEPDIELQLATLQALQVQVLALPDAAYPGLLREIFDPPPLLYLRGDRACLHQPMLAVVGSRRASAAGLRAAQEFSAGAVAAGLAVCSGLALGIDAAAHRGALQAGGCSLAVMATGIDGIYPRRHRDLAGQMLASGCLVTEFPPGMPPLRDHFPRRNRIISGLALGVLVVEAALPSGSLITAGTALEQGREVFTLPWSRDHPGGRGCLRLLRDGAAMALAIEDVLAQLGPLYALQQQLPLPAPVAAGCDSGPPPARAQLLDLIGMEAVGVDELVQRSELPLAEVLSALSALELAGQVSRSAGGYNRS